MKIYVPHPTRDEVFAFDLPDGARQMQVGALCSCGNDRRLVHLSPINRTFSCSQSRERGPFTLHTDWPRVTYRIEDDGDGFVAKVYEGKAPPFTVQPVSRGTAVQAYRAMEQA